MDSFLEPVDIMNVPEWMVALAVADPRVVVNLRFDQWPAELREKYKVDHDGWRTRAQQHRGLLMSPALTQFLADVSPGTNVVMSCQQAAGWELHTLVNKISAVTWAGEERGRTGVPAQIHFESSGCYGNNLWGHYVLAIAKVHPSVSAKSPCDPLGGHFHGILERSALLEQTALV